MLEPSIIRRDLLPLQEVEQVKESVQLESPKVEVKVEEPVKSNLNLSSVKGYREKKKELKYLKIKNEANINYLAVLNRKWPNDAHNYQTR